MGALVEGYGVKWGGTMHAIADPDEAWWIEICGKQWVAQRVGDGRATMRANSYRIGRIDFTDTGHVRYMWSPGVKSFARKRGWWRPAQGPFNWRRAYHWRGEMEWAADNTVRHRMVARYLKRLMARDGKVTRTGLMKILRSHYEGTRWYNHRLRPYTVCNRYNIASSVSELRGDLPAGIGGVLWTCFAEPCSNGFFPIYQGVTALPAEWTYGAYRWAPGSAYWACRSLSHWVGKAFGPRHRDIARRSRPFARAEFEQAYLSDGDPIEQARRAIARSFMGFGSDSLFQVSGFRANSNRSGTTPAHDWAHYPDVLPAMVERLRGVVIENRPASEVIRQHDSTTTLHYVDPPYVAQTRSYLRQAKYAYRFEMTDDDHRELASVLREAHGMVVISGYPCDLYDNELYPDWQRVERPAFADGARRRTEVLWLSPGASRRLSGTMLFPLPATMAVAGQEEE